MSRGQPIVFTLLFFILLVVTPTSQAQADATYTIPLLGGRWTTYTIRVRIPAEPAWAHDAVLNAMQVWNEAQDWFKETYYPQGKVYSFTESSTAQVNVRWVSADHCCWAYVLVSGHRITTGVPIDLTTDLGPGHTGLLTATATHEFGHALGLVDLYYLVKDGEPLSHDLMWGTMYAWRPSTLDLYAVHVLAEGSTPERVTLPSNIPYQEVPLSAIPEFPVSLPVLLGVVFAVSLLMLKRRLS